MDLTKKQKKSLLDLRKRLEMEEKRKKILADTAKNQELETTGRQVKNAAKKAQSNSKGKNANRSQTRQKLRQIVNDHNQNQVKDVADARQRRIDVLRTLKGLTKTLTDVASTQDDSGAVDAADRSVTGTSVDDMMTSLGQASLITGYYITDNGRRVNRKLIKMDQFVTAAEPLSSVRNTTRQMIGRKGTISWTESDSDIPTQNQNLESDLMALFPEFADEMAAMWNSVITTDAIAKADWIADTMRVLSRRADVAHAAAVSLGMACRFVRGDTELDARVHLLKVAGLVYELTILRDFYLSLECLITASMLTKIDVKDDAKFVMMTVANIILDTLKTHHTYVETARRYGGFSMSELFSQGCCDSGAFSASINSKFKTILSEVPALYNSFLVTNPVIIRFIKSAIDQGCSFATITKTSLLPTNDALSIVKSTALMFMNYFLDEIPTVSLVAGLDPRIIRPSHDVLYLYDFILCACAYRISRTDDAVRDVVNSDSDLFDIIINKSVVSDKRVLDAFATTIAEIMSDKSDITSITSALINSDQRGDQFANVYNIFNVFNVLTRDIRNNMLSGASRFTPHTSLIEDWYFGNTKSDLSLTLLWDSSSFMRTKYVDLQTCPEASMLKDADVSVFKKVRRPKQIRFSPVDWRGVYIDKSDV